MNVTKRMWRRLRYWRWRYYGEWTRADGTGASSAAYSGVDGPEGWQAIKAAFSGAEWTLCYERTPNDKADRATA